MQIDQIAREGRRRVLASALDTQSAAKRYSPREPEAFWSAYKSDGLVAAKDEQGELRFPEWQFMPSGGVVPGLPAVLRELRQSPAWGDMLPFAFLTSHHPLLEGQRPIDALCLGQIQRVVQAAAAARY